MTAANPSRLASLFAAYIPKGMRAPIAVLDWRLVRLSFIQVIYERLLAERPSRLYANRRCAPSAVPTETEATMIQWEEIKILEKKDQGGKRLILCG